MDRKWTMYVLVIIFCFFSFFHMSIISVLVEEIKMQFNVDSALVGTLSATMLYVYAPMQILVGFFADRFGAKPCLILGLLIMSIGPIIFALASNFSIAFISRIMIGIGASPAFVLLTYVPPHYFPKEKTNFLVCLGIGIALLGPIFAQTIFPFLIEFLGWRLAVGLFGALPILGVAYALLSLRKVNEEHAKTNPFKYLLPICKKPQTWIIAFAASFYYAICTSYGYLWGIPYFENSGYSLNLSGLITTAFFIGTIIASPKIGYLADKVFSDKSLILFFAFFGAVFFSIMLLFKASLWLIFICSFLVGIAVSAENLCYVLAIKAHPHYAKGMSVGMTNFLIILMSAIFQPLIGSIIQLDPSYNYVMWIFPILLVIVFILGLFIRAPTHD